MLTLPPSVRIYLAVGQVHMRRGHDGLAATVRGQWKVDLYVGRVASHPAAALDDLLPHKWHSSG